MKRPFYLAKFLCLAAILQSTNGLCPTRQDLEGLRSRIDGELILPGDEDYFEAGTMKSTNYNSGFNFVLYAKSIGTASVANPATSVGDKFRSGRVALSCGTGWGEAEEDKYYMTQFNKFTKDHLYHLGDGTYYNEPDPDLSNWKIAYWGTMDNYNRLLAVKKQLDPNNVLWCRNCVGSDETTYTTPCPSGINKSAATSCSFALVVTALVVALFQF